MAYELLEARPHSVCVQNIPWDSDTIGAETQGMCYCVCQAVCGSLGVAHVGDAVGKQLA